MRTYYIVDQHVAHGYVHLFHNSFWHDLPSGKVLLSVQFHGDAQQNTFESMPSVGILPHPFDPSPLDETHVAELQHLGINAGHTTKNVRDAIRKINARM